MSTVPRHRYRTIRYTISATHRTIPGTAIREMRFTLAMAWRWSAIDSSTCLRERSICSRATARCSSWRCSDSRWLSRISTSRSRISGESLTGHPSARARHAARLEEILERLAAEARDHLRVRHALHPGELLQAEEARPVAHQRRPVELAHHAPLLARQCAAVQGELEVLLEQPAVVGDGQAVQEAVEAQRPGAALEVEDVGPREVLDALELRVHARALARFTFGAGLAAGSSKTATAIAVVIGR